VGKSTLLNLLSGSEVFVENRLFATLDPTTRFVDLGGGNTMLMTDTVGFIRKLPHHLVASFKSTLEETTEADFLIHVVDISSKNFEEQIGVVKETLEELGAGAKTTIMVFNKLDRLVDRSIMPAVVQEFPRHVFVSATRGINILGLKEALLDLVRMEFRDMTVRMPQMQQRAISQLHDIAEVLEQSYVEQEVLLKVRVAIRDEYSIRQLVKDAEGSLESVQAPG